MILSLVEICQEKIIKILEKSKFYGKLVNDLCKYVPDHLLEPIFKELLLRGVINDTGLLAYLMPDRITLTICNAINIRNSVFKQIGMNCPYLVTLDLSDCSQIRNSVVRSILNGCHQLEDIRLDRCHRVTDSAFDFTESPFNFLYGCLSLEAISLQGCPQITGDIIHTLTKHCKHLNYLNLSQCKNVKSPKIQQIFQHHQLQSLNLAFIDDISDEAFLLLPTNDISSSYSNTYYSNNNQQQQLHHVRSSSSNSGSYSPLLKLNLCKSKITDLSIFRMAHLVSLLEIRLQFCSGITDTGILALVQNCPKLTIIDLKSCITVTDESILCIASSCKALKELDLSWCPGFTDIGLFQFGMLRSLTSHNRYQDVSTTTQVPIATSILGREGIVDSSYSPINEQDKQYGLEKLSLEWCGQITDYAINALSTISSLKYIKVAGCVGITESGVKVLKSNGILVES